MNVLAEILHDFRRQVSVFIIGGPGFAPDRGRRILRGWLPLCAIAAKTASLPICVLLYGRANTPAARGNRCMVSALRSPASAATGARLFRCGRAARP
jgi:hypothetical protein